MRPTRRSIPQRKPVYLACEGKSEQGYARFLNRLAPKLGVHVHIEAQTLGGGDPLSLAERAIATLTTIERRRSRFAVRALLLDTDRLGQDRRRDADALALANRSGLLLIWQRPCHEGFVLRHFPGYHAHEPPGRRQAEASLGSCWPGYRKGMDATRYEQVLGARHVDAARAVEPELEAFLDAIGWPRSTQP